MSENSSVNKSTPMAMTDELLYTSQEFYIGLGLAVSSSLFIGSSFIIKKKALIRLSHQGQVRAAAGGFGYLREWIWWAGLITMGIGEASNFAAYAFAPASLVTPLGALSVIVAAVMASKFLKERLNLLGKLGCLLCILGSTIIVIHSPKEVEIEDLNILVEKLLDTGFIIYVIIIAGFSMVIAFYLGPKYGHSHVSVYIILCSGVGSLTVMSCKALGLAIRNSISGRSQDFATWLPWFLILATVFFIAIQMNYLNKALDIFNTSIVTPVYYVIFTTLVIIASAILFKEWRHMLATDVVGDICGFFIVIIGVVLLNAFKDVNVSLLDVRGIMQPRSTRLNDVLIRQHSRDSFFDYGTNNVNRKI